ncbi:zinc finger protein 618-like isoform X2 [Megalops cyprinoides]|uniref:zinc finger protein 618-like isoform X2 n=1 Tax=Megalops cyprinoides TaxID=118141 RepID=UPI0018651946|nr:zinc finger protein 618-like isoform X2 [Megalops cyprinoides]
MPRKKSQNMARYRKCEELQPVESWQSRVSGMSAQEVPPPGQDQGDAGCPQGGSSPATVKREPGSASSSNGQVGDSNSLPPRLPQEGWQGRASEKNAQEVTPAPEQDQGDSSPSPAKRKQRSTTSSNGGGSNSPAEICVVLGEACSSLRPGSYVCGVCGKKYKYYNCFQTHVRAHRVPGLEVPSGEGGSQGQNNSFRYTCDICGKKYKYYSCFQEHRDLHAVDDPYEQVVIPDLTEEEQQVESYMKMGPKTGSYVCEFCGKQYKYFNPYQEHVALHAPIQSAFSRKVERKVQSIGDGNSSLNSSESAFSRKVEGKVQSIGDGNNSLNSSGTISPLVSTTFSILQKPFTCGACGIQFQFCNNLLEHMQSHAADNENHLKADSPKSSAAPTPPEQMWKSPPPVQRNHTANLSSVLPEKERQQLAERLLRVMCADLGALNVLGGKDFLKLAQTLVDTGARHGAYPLRDALGDVGTLALRQLPRMYNQVKVKVTCALGSSASPGIAVTCHAQTAGPDACYVLTAHQAEGARLRHYVLAVRELDPRDGGEQVHQWAQNVLSEFVMPEVRTVYVTEPRAWAGPPCGRAGACLRCAGCSLGAVVQAVLGRRSLQTRGLHELAELLVACRDIAGTPGVSWDEDPAPAAPTAPPAPPPPPCWDQTTEALLRVHERFEQICEAYGRSKATAPLLQGLNKHLLGTLAALLAPMRQAVLELSSEGRPTLQQVLPAYLRLEKLFTAKASEAGTGSKLCHYFLEALKEKFKVERPHQVAMVLDPQLKLRPIPAYQHDDIIAKVVEAAAEMKEGGAGFGGEDADGEGPPGGKRGRLDRGGGQGRGSEDEQEVRKEVFQYLSEPLFHATPNLFQYWSSVMEKYPRLARLALWLLAVPAMGVRGECAAVCEQTLAMKRRKQVTADDMNKLIFLKSNMA